MSSINGSGNNSPKNRGLRLLSKVGNGVKRVATKPQRMLDERSLKKLERKLDDASPMSVGGHLDVISSPRKTVKLQKYQQQASSMQEKGKSDKISGIVNNGFLKEAQSMSDSRVTALKLLKEYSNHDPELAIAYFRNNDNCSNLDIQYLRYDLIKEHAKLPLKQRIKKSKELKTDFALQLSTLAKVLEERGIPNKKLTNLKKQTLKKAGLSENASTMEIHKVYQQQSQRKHQKAQNKRLQQEVRYARKKKIEFKPNQGEFSPEDIRQFHEKQQKPSLTRRMFTSRDSRIRERNKVSLYIEKKSIYDIFHENKNLNHTYKGSFQALEEVATELSNKLTGTSDTGQQEKLRKNIDEIGMLYHVNLYHIPSEIYQSWMHVRPSVKETLDDIINNKMRSNIADIVRNNNLGDSDIQLLCLNLDHHIQNPTDNYDKQQISQVFHGLYDSFVNKAAVTKQEHDIFRKYCLPNTNDITNEKDYGDDASSVATQEMTEIRREPQYSSRYRSPTVEDVEDDDASTVRSYSTESTSRSATPEYVEERTYDLNLGGDSPLPPIRENGSRRESPMPRPESRQSSILSWMEGVPASPIPTSVYSSPYRPSSAQISERSPSPSVISEVGGGNPFPRTDTPLDPRATSVVLFGSEHGSERGGSRTPTQRPPYGSYTPSVTDSETSYQHPRVGSPQPNRPFSPSLSGGGTHESYKGSIDHPTEIINRETLDIEMTLLGQNSGKFDRYSKEALENVLQEKINTYNLKRFTPFGKEAEAKDISLLMTMYRNSEYTLPEELKNKLNPIKEKFPQMFK